jgi:hypothetical protein
MGQPKTSMAALQSGVVTATPLLTLWQRVAHTLKVTGILSS